LAETDVHFLFIDRSVQRLLRSYAEDIGEDREWLNGVFRGRPGEPAIIRHEPGHATHMHVRFYSPIAEETARRCYSSLIQQKKMLPMRYNITHLVSKGDTLIGLAKRYGTTVRAIKHANGMKTSMIQANRRYYIPRLGPAGPTAPKPLPPRRVPPARTSTGGPMALGPASPSGTVLSVGGGVVWAATSAPSILSSP
jgi:penicillin-insensitive murein endopeptidase